MIEVCISRSLFNRYYGHKALIVCHCTKQLSHFFSKNEVSCSGSQVLIFYSYHNSTLVCPVGSWSMNCIECSSTLHCILRGSLIKTSTYFMTTMWNIHATVIHKNHFPFFELGLIKRSLLRKAYFRPVVNYTFLWQTQQGYNPIKLRWNILHNYIMFVLSGTDILVLANIWIISVITNTGVDSNNFLWISNYDCVPFNYILILVLLLILLN